VKEAAALLILPLSMLVIDPELRSAFSKGAQLLGALLLAIFCMRASSALAPGDATH
jgi:hypothetical protein